MEEEEHAAIDKPSKVINVKGTIDGNIVTTASGQQLRYVYANRSKDYVIAAGTTDERDSNYYISKRSNFWDKTVGLYKYGDNYYGQCTDTDIDGFVKLYYKADDIIKGNINQYKDAYGMYKIGDKTYKNLETCDATGYHYTTAANEIVEIGSCEDSFEAVNNLIDQYAVKMAQKIFIIVIMDIFIITYPIHQDTIPQQSNIDISYMQAY